MGAAQHRSSVGIVELSNTPAELICLLQYRLASLEAELKAATERMDGLGSQVVTLTYELDQQRNRAAFYRVQGEGLAEDNRRLRSELGARAESL